ncbi:hypothetical protein LZ32DRAFT_200012 [Colletotrichum eremochloae]|nr:hypothetical protein LZ32DRAFT_200012 [Colletotrichum eremochloae]
MSHEINRLWQCNFCSAIFVSDNLLQLHFDEYRSRAAEAENCRAHANANADESLEERLHDNEELDTIKKNSKCPFNGCDRSDPFQKGQQLRVHYGRHVACEEVCVYCYKVFRVASEYIRHTREHGGVVEEKTVYTKRRCDRLIKQINQELMAHLRGDDYGKAKKRTWTEAALYSDASREPKRDKIGVFEVSPGLVLPDPRPVLDSVHDAGQANFSQNPVNLQPQTDMFLPTQEDEDLYTPSLFLRMNFCRYPPSADLESGLETVTGVETVGLQHTM